jgi:hypothetical protein
MKTPEEFISMFNLKVHGQTKTMQVLANDFYNLLGSGPFDRDWLQYCFMAGYELGAKSQEAKIKELQDLNSSIADDFEGMRSLWWDAQELAVELQAKLDGSDENT